MLEWGYSENWEEDFRMKDLKQQKRSHTWIWILVVAVIVIGGGYFWYHQTYATSNNTASSASSPSSQSQSTVMGSADSAQNANSNNDQPGLSSHGPKLASDIGPRETAAAILFYGAKKFNNQLYSGTFYQGLKNGHLYIGMCKLDEEASRSIPDPGMGMMYSLAPAQIDSYVSYTLGQDGTVYFYDVEAGPEGPTQREIGQASKSAVINFANQHGGAADIQKLGQVAQLN